MLRGQQAQKDKAADYRKSEYKSKHGQIKRESPPRVKPRRKKVAV